MATGISKTKWNNGQLENEAEHTSGLALVYEGKLPETQILSGESGEYACLYQKNNCNRLYYGDNLPALISLYQDAAWRGQIRLVYIDPPYATGSVFQSRNQEDAYTDLLSGSRYVEFIRQRLVLLRELLAADGSIYIHLDANMVFHIKIVMDELFGEQNFRGCITRKKCNPKNYTRRTYGNISDYILFYTKSDNYVWNRPYDEWTQEDSEREYPYIEEGTGRQYKKVPVHAPGVRNGATGQPWRGKLPPPGKHWQYTPDRLDEMDTKGEIYWSPTGNPRRKVFLDESLGKPAQDIWLDFKDAHNQNIQVTGYPTEKNPALLARIIQASSNPGDLVLDCFAGSGTTLLVANQLNRHWLGIDNSPQAIETILKRLAVGSEIMGDFVNKNGREGKTEKSEQVVRTLFDLIEEAGGQAEKPTETANQHQPITGFSLFATDKQAGDIKQAVEEWLTTKRVADYKR